MVKFGPCSLVNTCVRKLSTSVLNALTQISLKYPSNKLEDEFSSPLSRRKRCFVVEQKLYTKRRRVSSDGGTNSTNDDANHRNFTRNEDIEEATIVGATNKQISQSSLNKESIYDPFMLLKCYLSCLPNKLWNDIFQNICKMLKSYVSIENASAKYIYILCLEIFFCSKLHYLNMAETLMEYEVELIKRLRHCYKLRELLLDTDLMPIELTVELPLALERFQSLRSLQLAGENGRFSFHWVVDCLSRNCNQLESLTISYNWDDEENSSSGISKLIDCRNLRSLTLLHFGRISEFEGILKLLQDLKCLRYIYHKELFNVLSHIRRKRTKFLAISEKINKEDHKNAIEGNINLNSCEGAETSSYSSKIQQMVTFNFKTLDFYYGFGKWYKQRVYTCKETELDILKVCPRVECLSLVAPRNLNLIFQAWKIKVLFIVQDVEDVPVVASLCSLPCQFLRSLTLSEMCLTHEDISNIAYSCEALEYFKVHHGQLSARGQLHHTHQNVPNVVEDSMLSQSVPFPRLLEAYFIHSGLVSFDEWSFGNRLLNFFLVESPKIQRFELHVLTFPGIDSDQVSEDSVIEIVSKGCLDLRILRLVLDMNCICANKLIECAIINCPCIEEVVCASE